MWISIFWPSDDKILIEEIQKNPILYNIADAQYKNIILQDAI